VKCLLFFVLLWLVFGCAAGFSHAPQVCSRPNIMPYRVDAWLQDDAGHLQWIGTVDTDHMICTRWTMSGDRGRWGFGDLSGGRITWDRVWFQSMGLR
jgi:hypothetical protein